MEKKFQTLTITLENVNQADAIALKKMFEYAEYLGKIGSSRMCCFFADGDGSFRPIVSFEYPEELPDVTEIDGFSGKNRYQLDDRDFMIDSDSIAWEIYH
jgi:hypothetical protein